MEAKELFAKYNCLTDGFKRNYSMSVNERRYDMESTEPVELSIHVDRSWDYQDDDSKSYTIHRFTNNSWLRLIEAVALYLQEKAPKSKEELLAFRTEWSDAAIFTDYNAFANMVEFGDIYLSVNFTATHSSWIIGDLLEFYGVAKHGCDLIYHRVPTSEPEEIRNYVEELRKKEFKGFLMNNKQLDEEKADRIVNSFKAFNKMLSRMAYNFGNFFLLDNTTILSNLKSKLMIDIDKYAALTDKQKNSMKKYLDYYTDYYTMLKKKTNMV